MRTLARRVLFFGMFFVLVVVVPEWPWLRVHLARPLCVHDDDARGDLAYILSAGQLTIGERLQAAADLYHQRRVKSLLLATDPTLGRHDYVQNRPRRADEWSIAQLVFLGVPASAIRLVDVGEATLGTANEARAIAKALGPDVRRLVLVSSPTHLRRARLAFRRAVDPKVTVQAFAASALPDGPDFHRPLSLEYAKLALYAVWL